MSETFDYPEQEQFNFSQHTKEINLTEFDALCKKLYEQRAVVESMEKSLKDETARLEDLKQKVMAVMNDAGKEKYHVDGLGLLYFQTKRTASMPKDPEKRAKFFSYLRDKGIFEDLITVHSQTLTSFWNQEFEAAQSPDFAIPGIDEPSARKTLVMKRG